VMWPNAPAQARRGKGVGLSTETRSRRCLQPAGSTIQCFVFNGGVAMPPQSLIAFDSSY
jgi:hypothetical protein